MKKQLTLILTFILLIVQVTFSQPGILDCDFDADGKVTTDFNMKADEGRALAIQSDQKIVVAGLSNNGTDNDFALVRYNIDGTLDNSFGDDGKVVTDINNNDFVHSIVILPEGKILVAGHSFPSADYDVTIVQYNTDGSLDNTFGTSGVAVKTQSNEDQCRSMAVQNDGKIVIGGFSYNATKDFSVFRFKSDGTPDETFGSAGNAQTEIGENEDTGESVTIQQDGKIILAGYYDNGSDNDIALVRFDSEGELDDSFGESGIVRTAIGSEGDVATTVVLQDDGKIVVAGYYNNDTHRDVVILRYNTDGSLDESFGTGGINTFHVGEGADYTEDIVLQLDGKILIAGYTFSGSDYDIFLVRCNSDGTLDNTFGENGIVLTSFGSSNDYGKEVAIQDNGRIVVAGFTYNDENNDFAVARYLSGLNVGLIDFSIQDNSMLIYPNPFEDFAVLEFELTKAETISVELYSTEGKLVQTFISQETKQAGLYEEHLDIDTTIPEGSYLLIISNGNERKGIHINIR